MQSKGQKARAAFGHGWKPAASVPTLPQPKLFNGADTPKVDMPGGAVRRGGYARHVKGM